MGRRSFSSGNVNEKAIPGGDIKGFVAGIFALVLEKQSWASAFSFRCNREIT
ncbi:MAG: hypothetical protein AB7G15_01490 [Alphaproteobacteria bacterium]